MVFDEEEPGETAEEGANEQDVMFSRMGKFIIQFHHQVTRRAEVWTTL